MTISPLSSIIFNTEYNLGIFQFENVIDRLTGKKHLIIYKYHLALATQMPNKCSSSRAFA